MYYRRILDLPKLLKKKSFFLFGPRATGKSSLIAASFADDVLVLNLLRTDIYLELNNKPYHLERMIEAFNYPSVVVIDEVQKLPMLLNEVHRLIEERKILPNAISSLATIKSKESHKA